MAIVSRMVGEYLVWAVRKNRTYFRLLCLLVWMRMPRDVVAPSGYWTGRSVSEVDEAHSSVMRGMLRVFIYMVAAPVRSLAVGVEAFVRGGVGGVREEAVVQGEEVREVVVKVKTKLEEILEAGEGVDVDETRTAIGVLVERAERVLMGEGLVETVRMKLLQLELAREDVKEARERMEKAEERLRKNNERIRELGAV